MSYHDFIALILTAVSLIVTALGVCVGLLAVWGYSQFEKITQMASAKHLEEMLRAGSFRKDIEKLILQHLDEEMQKEGSPFRNMMRDNIEAMIYSDATKRKSAVEEKEGEIPFED